MPLYMDGQEINPLFIGGEEIESAHMWNGTGWDIVYEGIPPGVIWRDDFPTDRTDKWGDDWETQSPSVGRVIDGIAVNRSLSQNSGGFTWARYMKEPLTDDVMIRAHVVKPANLSQSNNNELILSLRGSYSFEAASNNNTFGVLFVFYTGSCQIMTNINGNMATRATGGQVREGDIYECTAEGNVYTLRNATLNTTLCQWVDTDNVFPVVSSRRYMHMYQEGNFPVFQSHFASYGTNWIEYGDLHLMRP